MVKLSDALGALLRDIAQSRIQADLFSKEASIEYSKDPVLKLFPVPRVEIRSLDLELAFAVTDAKQEDLNLSEIARPLLLEKTPDLRKQVLDLPASVTRRARQSGSILSLFKERQSQVESELDRGLESFLNKKIGELSEQILQDPEKFIETVSLESVRILREIATANKINLTFGAQFKTDIRERVADWSKTVSEAVKTGVDRSKANAFKLDVALTRDELANLSEKAISRVKLSVEMRNIELIESEDMNGQIVNKPIVS